MNIMTNYLNYWEGEEIFDGKMEGETEMSEIQLREITEELKELNQGKQQSETR